MSLLNKFVNRSLKNCILEGFNKENGKFFYSFEVTPKEEVEVNLSKFKKSPLFVDITWISNHNLKSDKISESPAFKFAEKINCRHIVNSLTCYQLNDHHVDEIIGIENLESLTILRGDKVDPLQKFKHANELIEEIRKRRNDLTIMVAGHPDKHPEAIDFDDDLNNLKQKIDAGADVILTQLTFSGKKFCTFVDRCRKIGIPQDIPIIPGLFIPRAFDELDLILKITSSNISSEYYDKLKNLRENEEKFQECGLSYTVNCIKDIQRNCSEFVRGFHFYTMNDLRMLQKLTEIIDFSE